MRVGKFIVIRTDEIKKVHSNTRFDKMAKSTLNILKNLQEIFDDRGYVPRKNADFALYDLNPKNPAHTGRITFPHRVSTGHFEPACGTGTVACGLAMVAGGEIDTNHQEVELLFESGGDARSLGGPEITNLKLVMDGGKVTDAYFSHSLVEIMAIGKI